MKIVLNVIKAILTIFLTITILALGLINVSSSTILSEKYILNKLEETNYYGNIYSEVKSSFENYIYQSGLDESVLDNIVTQDMVKDDVNLIISNIYKGNNTSINVDTLKQNLNNNIKNSLENKKISITAQKAIDEFVDKIANQYLDTMTHTSYESSINGMYIKTQKYIGLVNKVIIIASAVIMLLLLILNYKKMFRAISLIGISITSSGIFYIATNIVINQKVKIEDITILNGAISLSLRTILTDILTTIGNYGYIMLGVGLVAIIIGNVFINVKNKKYKQSTI